MAFDGYYDLLKAARTDNEDLEACIRRTVAKLTDENTDARRPGMLLGKIQSGKTRAFLGVVALAFDEGFDIAIVLTKGTKVLAKQTVRRISDDFAALRSKGSVEVYDIMSVPNLSDWEVDDQKLVFVVKKQRHNLERLFKLIQETQPKLLGKRTLIVDDEADFASIRFTKKRGQEEIEQGTTADQMDDLRRLLPRCSFLQVTATPYSLYLQPEDYAPAPNTAFAFEPKRPAFTELLPVHSDYVGGDDYFGEYEKNDPRYYLWRPVEDAEIDALRREDRRRVKTEEILTTPRVKALRHALVAFVVAAAIRRLQQRAAKQPDRRYAMIVHVETSRAAHSWQETVASEVIDAVKAAIPTKEPILQGLLQDAYDDIRHSVEAQGLAMPSFDDVASEFAKAFEKGGVITELVNSDNQVEALLDEKAELKLRTPYNIFIGGQILDRGITIPNLISFYYGRTPQRMQQDTVLQHSRMYGARARNDLAVTRFYTTQANYTALKRIHEFDSALRHAFETGAHDRGVAFVQRDANRIVPCAPNKILMSDIHALRPGGRWLPVGFQSKAKSHIHRAVAKLDELIPGGDDELGKPLKVDLQSVMDVLELIETTLEFDEPGFEFDWHSFSAAVEYYSRVAAPKPDAGHVFILTARNRAISRIRESGRFSDAPDTKQQAALIRAIATDLPALILLRQNGEKSDGWGGYPFWWPVLFAPMSSRASVFAARVQD